MRSAFIEGSEAAMEKVVIVDAVRSPIGKRGGGLSGVHPAQLLGDVLRSLLDRSGVDPAEVEQVVGGCVTQVGEQSFNTTRTAWLAAGLPMGVAATTVDTQCGSSQQATNIVSSMIAGGVVDVGIACGVEVMSRLPIAANSDKALGLGVPLPKTYFDHYEHTTQFEGAERIAEKWGVTRDDCDRFALESHQRAARAWAEGRFDGQVVPIEVTDADGAAQTRTRDEGLRDTSLDALAGLKPVARPDGVITAGSSSQISDGAGAVLMMSERRAQALGVRIRAEIVDTCLVGVDPVMMLTGPIDATERLFRRTGVAIEDVDVVEINEAFAPIVLAWERELGADHEKVNPNGGAIAHGHPLGATGSILMGKAVHELERSGGTTALVTMCCGGGLGTGTILQRR
jgi:acetyl-CoA C-acetyltransferase